MRIGKIISNLLKIIFLLLLIIVIALGGIFWFDRLGLIDYMKVIGPFSKYLPSFLKKGEVVEEDPLLLEKELLAKREKALEEKKRELESYEKKLKQKELELQEKEMKLAEEAKRLDEKEKVLTEKQREYDNYRENIKEQARYFTSMPPDAAVERLSKLDDLLVIDILRQIDRDAEEAGQVSLVPYYLSLMDPEKAATIQRKMTRMIGGEE